MNNQYLEILCAVTDETRTYWTRMGTAYVTKDGRGFRLKFTTFPTSADASIVLLPPRAAPVPTVTDDEFDDPSFPFRR